MEAQIFGAFIFLKKTPKYRLMTKSFLSGTPEDKKKTITIAVNLLMEKTKIPIIKSVNGGDLSYHFNWRKNGLATILATDNNFPKSVAHSINVRIGEDFAGKIPSTYWATASEDTIYYSDLDKIYQYQNRFSTCTSEIEVPDYVETTETIFDLYLSTLQFTFPEMTSEISRKIKLYNLRNRKSKATPFGFCYVSPQNINQKF
jgi:hypothetical protein